MSSPGTSSVEFLSIGYLFEVEWGECHIDRLDSFHSKSIYEAYQHNKHSETAHIKGPDGWPT